MVENFLRYRWNQLVAAPTIFWGLVSVSIVVAQQPVVMPAGVSPDQARAMAEAQRAQAQAQGGQPQPKAEEKKEGEKKEGEGADKKKEEGGDSIERPDKPPRVPDPRELDVALDIHGKVPPFNFIGQGWPDVMQWLANLSKSSLDWQKLPNDYVNLMNDRPKTVDEVRDDINRLLHARGYTAIQTGEVLSVFQIEKLDPSVIRRVTEDELYDLKPYDFVKVSFELPTGMEVDKAKDDIKQVLSPNAKVFPLVTTKRLLVIDAVANLRGVSELLNEERSFQDGRVVPKEFILKYARPQEVIDILYVVLGMDPKSRPTQMDLQLQQKKLELMTQMQQRGTDVSKMLKQDGPPVYLAYNKQRNSVLVNAPPEQMKIIEETIARLDVPFGDDVSAEATTTTAVSGAREIKRYPLTTLEPENFITTLEEIGGLSPYAEFKFDKKSKVLFALASAADHRKIAGLIRDFDGTGRRFKVIWLRRLPADAVAATIYNLMAGQAEEKEDDNRRRFWYPWDDYGNNDEEEEPVKGFGVDADIENNRLLLWANDAELDRVKELLIELGEIPTGEQDPRPVRFVQPSPDVSTEELLERLRDAWSATGQNELIIKQPPPKPPAAAANKKETKEDDDAETDEQPVEDRSAAARRPIEVRAQFVQVEQRAADRALETTSPEAAQPPGEPTAPATSPPPVTVTVTDDGRLMLSSKDPVALDRMQELIDQLSPPEKRFRVFHLKYVSALNMKWNLEDFFADELKGQDAGYMRDWYGFMVPKGSQEKGGSGLSKRRKLMISWDTPSNTILVANASPSQMMEIEQLINEYDQPAPADSVRTRRNAAIKVEYSRASTIAEAIKEVYRDLLSSRDKEFDRGNNDERQRGQSRETVTVFRYGGNDAEGGPKRPTPVKVGFEGALSLSADDVSNMIIISVQEELYDSVVDMIHTLDQEARPDSVVRVHRVNGTVTAEALREAIDDAMSRPWPGGKPEQQAGRGGRGRGDGEGGRGDRDRRGDRGRRNRGNDND